MANKVWFITGASRGFGLLVARDALARGDSVVAAARNPQAIVDALGVHPQLLPVQLDVTKEAAAVVATQAAIERFGRIDVLVNNAGYGILGAVEETSAEEVRRNYETNVFGLLNVSRAVLPVMRKQRSGHVINISSLGGYQAYYGWGVYGSTRQAPAGREGTGPMEGPGPVDRLRTAGQAGSLTPREFASAALAETRRLLMVSGQAAGASAT